MGLLEKGFLGNDGSCRGNWDFLNRLFKGRCRTGVEEGLQVQKYLPGLLCP